MGLDIRVSYKKMSNGDELENMTQYFCGRSMFECVRQWVGDKRYGEDILLRPLSDDYIALECAIIRDVQKRRETDGEEDFDYEAPLVQLARLVGEAAMLAKCGINMYLECDW